ncbi:dTDP-4-dehydrorhamnose reductase [Shewanella marina]|uniref:dTDP-4-dehydrorhamnose reductase n=1 Tax=Shewanella marina TaxID=487319 RepID=UPI00046E77E1|nr:dTDP-4-dehydrorhamnose reductase [Shewanella marina]
MINVLITGSQGQLGQALTQRLQDYQVAGQRVNLLALDRDGLDITDRAQVLNCVTEFAPQIIINAAAYTAVDKAESEVELAEAVNVKASQYLAEAATLVGAVLLHVSTDYVFSGDSEQAYIETDMPAPQSIYGVTKLAGEKLIAAHCDKHIILRTAWVFGEAGNNFVKTMLRLAQTRDTLGIVADQFGGPTYAGDIADALIRIMEQVSTEQVNHWGVYHFSGLPYVSWYEFADTIFKQAHQQGLLAQCPALNALTTAQYPTSAKRPANSRLDCSKIAQTFAIQPSDWQQALQELQAYQSK